MASIVAAAQAAWPAIDLAAEQFIRYLTDRLPQDTEIETAIRGIHTSDLYLACACVEGNVEALAAFERHCLAVIDRALSRLGLDADAVHEVKQRLRHALLVADTGPPRIAAFAGRGDLRSWVRITAMREALAIQSYQRRLVADEDRLVELVASGESPELAYFKRMYRREVELALREAIQALSDHERTLIKLQVLDRVTIQQIGRIYRVHRVTAGRWIEDARDRLLKATRARLLERLNVQPAELDSILRLVSSRLEISLGPLLGRRRG
jgi:RNA polymerase sigma-70 factor (ECF subfamily)